MPDAVIVSACRTAIGTARKGTLADSDPYDLARHVVGEAITRASIDPTLIDDVILGETLAGGGDIARHAAITAGVEDAPGTAVNRHCASGLAALSMGAASIVAGMDRAVVAGGVQSSSFMPKMAQRAAGSDDWEEWWIPPSHPDSPEAPNRDMSITVGWNAAQLAGVSREDMDAWALGSHQKAVAAIDQGLFLDEVTPYPVRHRDGTTTLFEVDEHPRRVTTIERLASLKPIHPEIEGFSITAGNSAGINDGAAALVLTSSDHQSAAGLERLATIRAWASVGVPGRDGVGSGQGHTEGTGPGRLLPRRHRSLRDQRSLRVNVCRHHTVARDRSDTSEPQRERLQPRAPDCHDGRTHGHDARL